MTEPNPVELNIKHALEKNGFPDKAVKLPFKPVYQSCKEYGTSLEEVLKNLKAQEFPGALEGDYIVFRPPGQPQQQEPKPKASGNPLDPSLLKAIANMGGLGDMSGETMQKALDSLTPEQREDIQKRVASMSAEDKQNMLQSLSQIFNSK